MNNNKTWIKNWCLKLIKPQSLNKNSKHKELLLNILLVFSITSFLLINLINLIDLLNHNKNYCLAPIYAGPILFFLLFIFYLSKKGKTKTASWLLLLVYSWPMLHLFIMQGIKLPVALLFAVLIISLFGLLIGASLSLISSGIIGIIMISLSYFQHLNLVPADNYWQNEINEISLYVLLLLLISTIIWLFARNLKQALLRAQASEKKLQQERDLLEIKVIKKTAALREIEKEKIIQLYRLANFGRLSSGVFHDLINPLSAVSLNLQQVQEETKTLNNVNLYLEQAIIAAHQIEDLMAGIKKLIQQKSTSEIFNINEEIKKIICVLAFKARRAKVKIDFNPEINIDFYGNSVKFGQIIMNLIANAIEANEEQNKKEKEKLSEKEVQIKVWKYRNKIRITIDDQGTGIAPENIIKIFDLFFTTKNKANQGLGVGLSSTKTIIEEDFQGAIKVRNKEKKGSQFIVSLPFAFPKGLS